MAGRYAGGNYHATLGMELALGRGFADEPDRPDGRAPARALRGQWVARGNPLVTQDSRLARLTH